MKRLAVLLLAMSCALLLSGCGLLKPVEVIKTVEVEKPVYWCPAVEIPRPAFAVDALPLGSDIHTQMKHLRAEREQRKAYEGKLEAALQSRNASAAQ